MWNFFETINKRDDFDRYLNDRYGSWPEFIRPYLATFSIIRDFDIVHIPVSGGFLGATPARFFECQLYHMAGMKVVVLPFGGDAYCYHKIKNAAWQHGLLCSYPAFAADPNVIEERLRYWEKHADAIIPGSMGGDGFSRWDVLTPSPLVIDTKQWKAKGKYSNADGKNEEVTICHAPNHRGCKGTEFVIHAVDQLRAEGLKVKLLLLEELPNEQVLACFHDEADIIVEQILFAGYAMTAMEGMATGLPVMGNVRHGDYAETLRWFSFLAECPVVAVTPDTLKAKLRELIISPKLRQELGQAGRRYVEKYHSFESARNLFGAVYKRIWYGEQVDLINLFHPLMDEMSGRTAQNKEAV